MKRFRTGIVVLGLAALVGSACASEDPSTVGAGAEDPAAGADHNAADIAFAQGMIPHHEQAVEMARLATDRAGDARVTELASRIEGAQAPEIEEMTGWLDSWGEPVSSGAGMEGMDHGGDAGGMMTDEQMVELEAASGTEFDQLFLQMMIAHHRGAIEMADTELIDGQFADALALAGTIKSTQADEIAEMESILAELDA